VFDGTISAVTGFGIFVALDTIYVEGLVHVSELGEDYFQFDNVKHQMLGERTGQRYRLGDRVRVKLVRADLESNKIDFVLVRDDKTVGGRKQGGRTNAKAPTGNRGNVGLKASPVAPPKATAKKAVAKAAPAKPAKRSVKTGVKQSAKPATKKSGKRR